MRDSCENIASKLKEIEDEQEIENKVYLERESVVLSALS